VILNQVYGDDAARDDAESAVQVRALARGPTLCIITTWLSSQQVVEEHYDITSEDFSWVAPEFVEEWRAEAEAQGWCGQDMDAFEHKFMFAGNGGIEEVTDAWFASIKAKLCD
jgi:hypothetical protein